VIIRAIRLKNIKSYGEGADGTGVTIHFQPGVNRIAGRNGHGKSTLIEALGYALFNAEPPCLENFDLTTYFLRAGAKAGEIDITFSHGPETYRVERGLGAGSKRRSKVVLVDDDSVCAEDDREVSGFLGRLLGFPDPKRFADVFLKLLGVKQGHLTRPFDAKPGQAKDFFEPLLEVEVFRQCFDRIKPAVDQFETEFTNRDRQLAGLEERVRERQDSTAAVAAQQEEVAGLALRLDAHTAALAELGARRSRLDAQAAALAEAGRLRDEALRSRDLLAQRRGQTEAQVAEARDAVAAAARLEPGYQACLAAEAQLRQLRARQDQRRQLEAQRARTAQRRVELDAQAQAALGRAELFAGQGAARAEERRQLQGRRDALGQRLDQGLATHQAGQAAAHSAEQALAVLAPFRTALGPALTRQQRALTQLLALEAELGAWDPAALTAARELAAATREQHQEHADRLTSLLERQRNLDQQLRQIGSGVCPFLKERCRQFDPAKVQIDLDLLEEAIRLETAAAEAAALRAEPARTRLETLERQGAALDGLRIQLGERASEFQEALDALVPAPVPVAAARLEQWPGGLPGFPRWEPAGPSAEARQQAAAGFQRELEAWWSEAEPAARTALAAQAQADRDRLRDQQEATHQSTQLTRLSQEITEMAAKELVERNAAQELARQAEAAAAALADLAVSLAAFSTLDQELADQTAIQESHRPDHLEYLVRKPIADQLAAREAALDACVAQEQAANEALTQRGAILAGLQAGFDPQALAQATAAFLEKNAETAGCRADLQHAEVALKGEQARHAQWLEACAARDRMRAGMARIRAAGDLGELARSVLKNAAPAVAQHLCTAIAGRAQGIFNLINPDPVELQWSSTRYSLRIIPGERRFAMLSGGEQTKLALAMTLAMIQEFSGLRFCIFDEPTYGVDAESRARLADAILAARKAAGLDQLLLVSHDDAFEGRVEHAILLTKSAAGGTRAALED
jgi:exonuclease SbcC